MTLTRPITLPPSAQGGGGVLNNAGPLEDGWTRGVEFATGACLAAGEHVFCPDSPSEKSFQGSTLAQFEPFGIEVGVVCSTLSGDQNIAEREARAFDALQAKAEKSVGYVLATGTTQAGEDTGNPALVDASSGGASPDPQGALAILDTAIADNLGGLMGWIHVTPEILVQLVEAFAIYRDAGQWFSPNGNLVVASPGYVAPLDDLLVASTPVYAEVGEIQRIQTVDRSDNRYLVLHEAPAIAVFDPCFLVSVEL